MLKCDNCNAIMMTTVEGRNKQGVAPLCPSCGEPPHKQYYICCHCGSTKVMIKEWINPNTNEITPKLEQTMLSSVRDGDDDVLETEAECYGFCSTGLSWRDGVDTKILIFNRACALLFRTKCETVENDRRAQDGWGPIEFDEWEDQ